MGLQEYRCPCCGGSIEFNSTVGKMKCPFCDTEFEMDSLKDLDQALDQEEPESMTWNSYEGQSWSGEDMTGMAACLQISRRYQNQLIVFRLILQNCHYQMIPPYILLATGMIQLPMTWR